SGPRSSGVSTGRWTGARETPTAGDGAVVSRARSASRANASTSAAAARRTQGKPFCMRPQTAAGGRAFHLLFRPRDFWGLCPGTGLSRLPPMSTSKEAWGSRLGVIMAVAGSAVGLGNFLRFPGLAAQYGGGAFMLAYAISFLIIGL